MNPIMNELEEKFKKWLDTHAYPFVFIDQAPITQSEEFKSKASRPDFFITLDNKDLIAVDIKQRKLNPNFNTFNLDKINQERLASFEALFNVPLWVAFTTESNEFNSWHWIGINEVIKVGKLIKGQYGEFWAISIEKCNKLEWNDELEIIADKIPQQAKLNVIQHDVINEVLKLMEINDNELKKSIRKRRIEQKRLEKRIVKVERDYMVKPSVFIKKLQKDINEKVKKMKEKLSKTFSRE